MNTQLLIQQLKQLPRVGQGGDDRVSKTSSEKTAETGQSTQGVDTTFIDVPALTAASKVMQELNGYARDLTTLLSMTIKPVEQLNKALGTTTIQSKLIFDNFRNQNKALREINISDTQRIKQAEVLGKIIPGQLSNLSALEGTYSEILNFQTQAVVQAGANEAAVANFNKLLLVSGENTSNVRDNLLNSAKAIQLATGETSVFRDMLNAVGAVSSATRQEFRGTTEELAEAAFQATRMGTTLDEVRIASVGYLNIESSIQKELEAQLMTGINMASEMNQIRSASYTGDYDEVLRIQNKLIEENFEAIKEKGPMALRSFAASLNLTDEQLANQYETIKATNALIEQTGKRTLSNLPGLKNLTDKQQKQLDAFKEQVAASKEFQGMEVDKIDLRQILEVPELQESFEELIVSTGKIQDTRDQSEKLTAAQATVTDAIAGAYTPESFEGLITKLDNTTNTLFSQIDKLFTGEGKPDSLESAFKAVSNFLTGDFKTNMSKTMQEATLTGVTQGMAAGVSENHDKLTDKAQASSKK
jgi:hypothetical protein